MIPSANSLAAPGIKALRIQHTSENRACTPADHEPPTARVRGCRIAQFPCTRVFHGMNSYHISLPSPPHSPPFLEPLITHSPRAAKSRLHRHALIATAAAVSIVTFGVLSGCASASEPAAEPAPTVTVTTTATLPVETVMVTVTAAPEIVVPAEEVNVPEAAPVVPEPVPEPAPEPVPLAAVPVEPPSNVYYKNCTAARDAGAAPVYAGEPGYGPHLDRDGDGVGCE